ncbi:MAG: hypothetical protein QF898_18445 [SAR202 cluster bacterium]|jgi:hypothetical protein|nr:hypothetical protein [SAR202 cluster bacterium]MDP6512074.1 hypothetical protein [SAR202 cluster bacterium]MDP6715299.1 hypothetical protein [SAR202 cluster bacterium]
MLNVREAHPGENIPQPDSLDVKSDHAQMLKNRDDAAWTVAVDDLDGTLHQILDGKPNATYLMDTSGKTAYRSLWARDEGGLRAAVENASRGRTRAKTQSRAMMVPVAKAMGRVQGREAGGASGQARPSASRSAHGDGREASHAVRPAVG